MNLNGTFEITKVTLTAQQADTRVDPDAIRVFVSDTNEAGDFRELFAFNCNEYQESGEEVTS